MVDTFWLVDMDGYGYQVFFCMNMDGYGFT